jgi:hypothetical protein
MTVVNGGGLNSCVEGGRTKLHQLVRSIAALLAKAKAVSLSQIVSKKLTFFM